MMNASLKDLGSKTVRLAYAWYCIQVLGLPPLFAAPPQPQLTNYRVVFSDDFNTLDLGLIEDSSANKPHTWYEGVWFSEHHAPRKCFSISQSALTLQWNRGQLQPDASISTFSVHNPNYHAWRYGYFEVRMKWSPVPGAWPAVWLIPVQGAGRSGPQEAGEIDLFEGQGDQPHTYFATIHHWRDSHDVENTNRRNHFDLPPNADFANFHTYGLLWVPGQMTWYFDGVPLHTEKTYRIFDQQDYLLIIGMQEGSDWKMGDLTGVSAQSLSLTVDWVRVWQTSSK